MEERRMILETLHGEVISFITIDLEESKGDSGRQRPFGCLEKKGKVLDEYMRDSGVIKVPMVIK